MADPYVAEWAGAERVFKLGLGELFDIEDSCAGLGFGEIYFRIARHSFKAQHLFATIKYGLVGGGMEPAEAEKLVRSRWESYPVSRIAQLALNILIATMEGIPPTDKNTGSAATPFDQGAIFDAFRQNGIAPQDVRGMAFKDFVLLCRAVSGNRMQAPTEEEMDKLIRDLGPAMGYVDPAEAEAAALAAQAAAGAPDADTAGGAGLTEG